MHYHIILTEVCNLKCKYCYEKSMKEFENGLEKKWDYDEDVPFDSKVDVKKLKSFLKSEDTLIFYGGEPLLKIDKIIEIMDNLNCRFCIQTNGMLLDKIPEEYLFKLDKMLVSIDGCKERDNENKGLIHYDKVVENLKLIRLKGYKGEIVARMVIEPFYGFDIYEQVLSLLDLNLFDSIHWQIDAGFYKFDFDEKKFSEFIEKHNKSVSKLIDYWLDNMNLRLYPFIGILNRLKEWDKENKLPCGAGHSNFTINTKGDLCACPIMNSVKNFYCGSIDKGIERNHIIKDEICEKCEVKNICGGRCLYWREAKLWPTKGDELICKTIKHLIEEIKTKTKNLDLKKEDFEYEKYFGPEIIP